MPGTTATSPSLLPNMRTDGSQFSSSSMVCTRRSILSPTLSERGMMFWAVCKRILLVGVRDLWRMLKWLNINPSTEEQQRLFKVRQYRLFCSSLCMSSYSKPIHINETSSTSNTSAAFSSCWRANTRVIRELSGWESRGIHVTVKVRHQAYKGVSDLSVFEWFIWGEQNVCLMPFTSSLKPGFNLI